MFLLDTNIILELLLDQAHADEVTDFLERTPTEQLFVSEFTLYSLGVILLRQRVHDVFERVVEDLILLGGVQVIRLALPTCQMLRAPHSSSVSILMMHINMWWQQIIL